MHMSVASVDLNLQLPKNPATNLPAWSFSFFFMFFLPPPFSPPFSYKERKVGSPVASISSESSVGRHAAHVPSPSI